MGHVLTELAGGAVPPETIQVMQSTDITSIVAQRQGFQEARLATIYQMLLNNGVQTTSQGPDKDPNIVAGTHNSA